MVRSRVMYIESKAGGLANPGRIGRVTFSKSGLSIYYGGRSFYRLGGHGAGAKANYAADDNHEEFWISGPRRDGADGLYGRITTPADVDADVATEYWRDIRGTALPESATRTPRRRA